MAATSVNKTNYLDGNMKRLLSRKKAVLGPVKRKSPNKIRKN